LTAITTKRDVHNPVDILVLPEEITRDADSRATQRAGAQVFRVVRFDVAVTLPVAGSAGSMRQQGEHRGDV
jgi:hypothetical protein